MRKQEQILQALNNSTVQKLTNIVEETLAMGFQQKVNTKFFTAIDLWNIQRRRRAFTQRRAY